MIELFVAFKWPLIVLQGLFSLLLIVMILLQAGKGDDIASALSGQSGGGVQGSGGASKVLVRGTVIFAILFMVNSVALAKIFKELSVSSIGTSVSEPLAPASETSPAASPGAEPAGASKPAAPATTPAEKAPSATSGSAASPAPAKD